MQVIPISGAGWCGTQSSSIGPDSTGVVASNRSWVSTCSGFHPNVFTNDGRCRDCGRRENSHDVEGRAMPLLEPHTRRCYSDDLAPVVQAAHEAAVTTWNRLQLGEVRQSEGMDAPRSTYRKRLSAPPVLELIRSRGQVEFRGSTPRVGGLEARSQKEVLTSLEVSQRLASCAADVDLPATELASDSDGAAGSSSAPCSPRIKSSASESLIPSASTSAPSTPRSGRSVSVSSPLLSHYSCDLLPEITESFQVIKGTQAGNMAPQHLRCAPDPQLVAPPRTFAEDIIYLFACVRSNA